MSERLLEHYQDLLNKINISYKSEFISLDKACKLHNTKIRQYYTMCNTLGLESVANCPQKSSVKHLPQLDKSIIRENIPTELIGGLKRLALDSTLTTGKTREPKKLTKIEQDVEFFDSELLKSDIVKSKKHIKTNDIVDLSNRFEFFNNLK